MAPLAMAPSVYGLIPALLQRHLAHLGGRARGSGATEGRRTWLWDEVAELAVVEALIEEGMLALAIDRDAFLRCFGRFFFAALVPSARALALHPDSLVPRFDVLFGPPSAGRGGHADQDWSFPGPLMRLEDIQSELQICFPRMVGPSWAPPALSRDGRLLHLACRPGRPGWGGVAVGLVEALAPRCGGELVGVAPLREASGSDWLELSLAARAAGARR